MTTSALGCVVVRRVTGRRLPQRSDKGKSTGLGVQHQAISSEWPLEFRVGPTCTLEFQIQRRQMGHGGLR